MERGAPSRRIIDDILNGVKREFLVKTTRVLGAWLGVPLEEVLFMTMGHNCEMGVRKKRALSTHYTAVDAKLASLIPHYGDRETATEEKCDTTEGDTSAIG